MQLWFSKGLVIICLLAIFYSLGSALFFLVKDKPGSNRIVKALTWRIGISMGLFVLLFILFSLGLLHPHPLGG